MNQTELHGSSPSQLAETEVRQSRGDIDQVLREIVAGTAAVIGDAFFRELVSHLAEALQVRWAFVAEFAGTRARVKTIAFWSSPEIIDNVEYDLRGTPCEPVLAGETRLYSQGVADLFPDHPELGEMGVESFLAMPLVDSRGDVMGHLAIMDDKPFTGQPRNLSVFKVFGSRVAAELERRNAEHALGRSEARLASILRCAADAIVTIDAKQHITMFNPSAEKLFGCSQAWAVGQPFERFLSKPFRHLLSRYLEQPCPEDETAGRQVWAPEGITALRADGKEFPVELTISEANAQGEFLYTVILRDINERKEADSRLKHLMLEAEYLKEEIRLQHGPRDIESVAPAMREVLVHMQRVAVTDSTVLLTGETGVGKELIARAIHARSRRGEHALIKVNCAALPSELIESELFGHEKGAFSGAVSKRVGRFELASGGTLFLDELGELTPAAQAKLLRVLQEQEFERVGGSEPIRTDARVIAATNRQLADMVRAGSFREDLFFRLNVFPIRIPALRERPEDIPLLASDFLQRFARKLGRRLQEISPAALKKLINYSWPGNVRELQNVIERAAILTEGTTVESADIALGDGDNTIPGAVTSRALQDTERHHIIQVLEDTGWTVEGRRGAAEVLGLAPSTLRSKMKRLGIRRSQ